MLCCWICDDCALRPVCNRFEEAQSENERIIFCQRYVKEQEEEDAND